MFTVSGLATEIIRVARFGGEFTKARCIVYNLSPMSMYEQLASDDYWTGPPVETGVPVGAHLIDFICADLILEKVEGRYRRMYELGVSDVDLAEGAELGLDVMGLLKVVKDTRGFPAKELQVEYLDPKEFDEQAIAMTATPLFTGASAYARVQGQNGPGFVGRKTYYLTNAPSNRQLAGKVSHDLPKLTTKRRATVYQPRVPVGSVANGRYKGGSLEQRIVAASVIRPAN